MQKKTITFPYIDIVLIALLICATILLNLVMIRDGLNGMTDMKWHLTWLQHFYQQLSQGIWYPRWLAGTNYGYGSPTFVFYPPLVYYLGSFLKFLGLSTKDALIFLFSLAIFLSGFNFYLWGFKTWGKLPSFAGALFYMSTPYLAFDIYYRSGLASVFVQAWIPLLLLTTQKTLVNNKFLIGIAISWCLIALTHTPSLLLCSIVYFLYLILLSIQKGWKNIINPVIATLCGWGMASIYLIPAILEKSFVNTDTLKNVLGGFRYSLIGTGIPLFSISVKDLVNIPYIFIYQSLSIILFFIVAILPSNKNRFFKNSILLWLIIAVILAFLMSGLSLFIWESSSILQMVQFPWRFLQFYSVIGAIMCTFAIKNLTQVKLPIKFICLFFVLILMLGNFGYGYKLSRQFITLNYSGQGNTEHLDHIRTILNSPYNDNLKDVPEYRPLLNSQDANFPQPVVEQPKLLVLKGKASIKIQKWRSYFRKFKVSNSTLATIRIRTYYYPAWHLYVNKDLYPIEKYSDGTIIFTLQPGEYNIQLIYQMTIAFLLGIFSSILSLILFIFYYKFLLKKITFT